MIYQSWDAAWPELCEFLKYPDEIRLVVYTANAIESLNYQLRKVTRNRPVLAGAVTGEQKLVLEVALSHEARRDGIVTADNNIETRDAVTGHTEMAVRLRAAGYNIADNPLIVLDLAVYDYAKSAGDMSLMYLYADTLYRSEGGDFMEFDWDAVLSVLASTSEQIEKSANQDMELDHLANASNLAKSGNIGGAAFSALAALTEAGSDMLNAAIVLSTGGINPLAIMNTAAKMVTALEEYKQWPEDGGFLGGFSIPITAQEGTVLSRIGRLSGSYVAPLGTTMSQRGLPSSDPNKTETLWEVAKPFSMRAGISAAWKDSTGVGIQYLLPDSVDNLWKNGYIYQAQRSKNEY
jgi:hypothetical protein